MPFISLFCINLSALTCYCSAGLLSCLNPIACIQPVCCLFTSITCFPLSFCCSCVPFASPLMYSCFVTSCIMGSCSELMCVYPCQVCSFLPFSFACFPCMPCSQLTVLFAQCNVVCMDLGFATLVPLNLCQLGCVCVPSCVPFGSCVPLTCISCCTQPMCFTCYAFTLGPQRGLCSAFVGFVSLSPCLLVETVMIPTHCAVGCCECMCPPFGCMNCAWVMPMSLCTSPCTVPLFIGAEGMVVTSICAPCITSAPCFCACPPVAVLLVPCSICAFVAPACCGISTISLTTCSFTALMCTAIPCIGCSFCCTLPVSWTMIPLYCCPVGICLPTCIVPTFMLGSCSLCCSAGTISASVLGFFGIGCGCVMPQTFFCCSEISVCGICPISACGGLGSFGTCMGTFPIWSHVLGGMPSAMGEVAGEVI